MISDILISGYYFKVPILLFLSMVAIFIFSIAFSGIDGGLDSPDGDFDISSSYFGRLKHLFTVFGLLISSACASFISILLFLNIDYLRDNFNSGQFILFDVLLTISILISSLFISNKMIKKLFLLIKESQGFSISDIDLIGSKARVNRLYRHKYNGEDYIIGRAITKPTEQNGDIREVITFILTPESCIDGSCIDLDSSFDVLITGVLNDYDGLMDDWYKHRAVMDDLKIPITYSVQLIK